MLKKDTKGIIFISFMRISCIYHKIYCKFTGAYIIVFVFVLDIDINKYNNVQHIMRVGYFPK